MTITIDTSRLDRMDVRNDVLALDEKRKVLMAAFDAVKESVEAAIEDEVAAVWQIYNRERNELQAACKKRIDEIRAAHGGGDEMSAAEALEEHDAAPAYAAVAEFYEDDTALSVRCCVCGLPILDDDETVEDRDGRKALAAVLPWPAFDGGDAADDDADDDAAVAGGIIDAIADGVQP